LRLGLLISGVVLVSLLAVMLAGGLQGIDNWMYSLCFKLRGYRPAPREIVIVGIDSDSIDALGADMFRMHAALLKKLDAAKARVVAFDISDLVQLSRAQAEVGGVEEFAAALAAAKCGTVLPFLIARGTEVDVSADLAQLRRHSTGDGQLPRPVSLMPGRLATPSAVLERSCRGLGGINVYLDSDSVLRSMPLMVSYENVLFPSLALESYRQYRGVSREALKLRPRSVSVGDQTFAALPSGEYLVNYFGGYEHFETLSYREVLDEKPTDLHERVADKLVLVGPVSGLTAQFLLTPTDARLPGVELNANAIGNLLGNSVMREVPSWAVIVLMVALTMLLGLTLPAAGVFRGAAITIIVFAGCFALIFWRFTHNVWLPMAGPLLCGGIIGVTLVTRSAAMADRLRTEANIRLQSRMQAISGVGRLIDSSLERADLLNEIMHWVEAELEVEATSMLLLDKQTKRLSFEVALGEKGDAVKDFTLALGEGIAGTVAQTAEPILINSAARDPRCHRDIPKAIDYPLRNVLCVPMLLHGEVVGVIEIMNKQHNMDFAEYDAHLLTVIAQQAALFLETARLYAILQSRVDYANAELRAANQRLASEKAKVETMVQEMVDGVVATDEADRIVLINRAAERMLGLLARQVIGEPVLASVRQPDLVRLWAMPLSPHGGIYTEDIEMSDEKPLSLHVTVALVGSDTQIAGKCMILTDVTEFKQIDQLKTDLIGFVSHELKTPLTNIGLYTELLQDRFRERDEMTLDLVQVVSRQAIRMQHMVEDFLNLSRIEADRALAMNMQKLDDVDKLVSDIVALEGYGRASHRFEVDLPDPVPALWADRTKVEEILANLVGNAIKFSPNGGTVAVAGRAKDGFVQFSVRDEGVGIAQSDLQNLFKRFQRVGSTVMRIPGTGLGLFVCKHLVEAQGGSIWVESTEGEGSTFHFTLPAYRGQDRESRNE